MAHTVLLVGLGQIGMGYDFSLDPAVHVYSHARAFHLHDAFLLEGAVDPDPQARERFRHGFRSPAYADLDEALTAGPRPDVVVIATPTQHHPDVLRRVLEGNRPRVILCEKPLSYDLNLAAQMVRSCADSQVRLYVNYMRRSDPGASEVQRRIASGELGGEIKGVCWYSKGFLHNGSHFFNLLEWWLGPMRKFNLIDCGRRWNGTDREPDVQVTFARGTIVFLAAREEDYSHYEIELVASRGRLRYEAGGRRIEWASTERDPTFTGYVRLTQASSPIPTGMNISQWNVVNQLASMLREEPHALCSGAEALNTLKSMHQIIAGL